jgi:hypothetical protein
MIRAAISVAPPTAKGTMIFTGLSGHEELCAKDAWMKKEAHRMQMYLHTSKKKLVFIDKYPIHLHIFLFIKWLFRMNHLVKHTISTKFLERQNEFN